MLGIELLDEQGLPAARLIPGTRLAGCHMHSSASVKVALVKLRAPLFFQILETRVGLFAY